MRSEVLRAAVAAACLMVAGVSGAQAALGATVYRVDCGDGGAGGVLRTIEEVNRLKLRPGDSVLFKRGSTCRGALQPQGSGDEQRGITFGAFGSGALPRIVATKGDEAVLRFFNQERFSVSSLDLSGSTTFGVFISGDAGVMHDISLSNLSVHDVRGPLRKKQSGLVVVGPVKAAATFAGLHLDGIRAYNTTQWSGIFVAGGSLENPATDASVTNSVVHDVQGDGIVLFSAARSVVRHSVAWHTGMQHQQSIGTPNAIWTWQCRECLLEENEAFLADSPGVDGGAFDIDWGNTANTVRGNFGHDTAGYCVSVFGANGPTKQSAVEDNLCLHNGLSPRLAQRQGAILLMTWNGGSIDGLVVARNRVTWDAAGDTPLVQSGAGLKASDIKLVENELRTTGTRFVDPALAYEGSRNRYLLEGATDADAAAAGAREKGGHVERAPDVAAGRAGSQQWQIVAEARHGNASELAQLMVNLKTAAVEYGHAGLRVELRGDADVLQAGRDWGLVEDGVVLRAGPVVRLTLRLAAGSGKGGEVWRRPLTPIELGTALRGALGEPVYGRLSMENVRATD